MEYDVKKMRPLIQKGYDMGWEKEGSLWISPYSHRKWCWTDEHLEIVISTILSLSYGSDRVLGEFV